MAHPKRAYIWLDGKPYGVIRPSWEGKTYHHASAANFSFGTEQANCIDDHYDCLRYELWIAGDVMCRREDWGRWSLCYKMKLFDVNRVHEPKSDEGVFWHQFSVGKTLSDNSISHKIELPVPEGELGHMGYMQFKRQWLSAIVVEAYWQYQEKLWALHGSTENYVIVPE